MRTRHAVLPPFLVFLLSACGGSTAEEIITCRTAGACTMTLLAGADQTETVGNFLPEDPVVEITHVAGPIAEPVNIRWSVVSGGGTVTASVAEVGMDEMFRSTTRIVLGETAGPQVFRATLVEDPSVSVDIMATGTPGSPRELQLISGDGQSGEVATVLPEALVVRVIDAFGNTVPEVRVGWSISAGGGTIDFEATATDAQGESRATATLGEVAGVSNNLYVATAPMIQGAQIRFRASATAGEAETITLIGGDAQAGVREGQLPEPLAVQIADRFDNPVAGVSVTFSALTEGASVLPELPTTDDTGTATAAATLGPVGGEYRFRAELANRGSVVFTASAFPPLCSNDDWCWVAPVPQGNAINDSFSLTPNDVWVVGDYGTILRWQGVAWEAYAVGTISDLNGVYAMAEDDVWAVGDNGTIARFDGTRWRVIDSGVLSNLNDVWAASPTAVYAVGDFGVQLRYDGTRWAQLATVTDQDLNGVWAASPREIYVAGDRGVALVGDGTTWQMPTTNTTNDLNAVWGTSASNVWFVGDDEAFLRWQGQVFQTFPSTARIDLRGVWGRSANEVFAVGDSGRIRRFDGGSWRPELSPTPRGFRSVTGIGDGVLAVGEGGVFARRSSNQWNLETSRRLRTIEGIWGTAPDSLWAVGEFGSILSWNGTVWTELDIGIITSDIIAIDGVAADDVWAVGEDGTTLRYTGEDNGWSIIRTDTEEALNAVHVISSTLAWAVGDRATIQRWDGMRWNPVDPPMTVFGRLNGVWAAAPDDVWAVGDSGVLLHFDGSVWTQEVSPTGNALLGIAGRSANEIYAFGFGGTLLRYDGATWIPIVLATNEVLFSMHFAGPLDFWLVGGGGTILRNQGGGWILQESGTNNGLNGVFGTAPDDVWVVGEAGSILRWNPMMP